jgi:hypothetical protein
MTRNAIFFMMFPLRSCTHTTAVIGD